MTKKHFEEFADYIRSHKHFSEHLSGDDGMSLEEKRAMAAMVVYVASDTNPYFDRARFMRACGLKDCL